MTVKDDELLDRFKIEFESDYKVSEEQRDNANEEYRFFTVPGGQWEGFLESAYEGRAKLELDQTGFYVYRTYGQWTQNKTSIRFSPDDGETSKDDAELLNGLYRRDFRRNNGNVALGNAVLEVFGSGTGAFHISTEYEDDESFDNDLMNCSFNPIHDAFAMIAWDSGAQRIDKRDAGHCTLIKEYSRKAFEKKYPNVSPTDAAVPTDRREFNWTQGDSVFVAIRYEVKKEEKWGFKLIDPLTGAIEELFVEVDDGSVEREAKRTGMEVSRKKKIKRQYVVKSVFTGDCFIEKEKRIPGKYIPIIQLYGYRYFIDGVEYYHGLVRKNMDAQRLFNMEVSLVSEQASKANQRIPLFDPQQMKGLENHWKADLSKKNYMLARPIKDKQGNIIHSGPTGYLEPSVMDESARNLIEMTSTFIQSGTGGAPQETLDTDASGKALNALIKQIDLNTQPVMENISTAMKWAGEVYRWIAKDIYAKQRTVNTLGIDGKEKPVMLMQQVMDEDTGEMKAVNDLSRGRFEVIPDTGPGYETQREEMIEVLKDILGSLTPDNPYYSVVLAMLIENLDGPGIEDLKNHVRKDLIAKGVKKPETPEEEQMLEALTNQEDPQQQLIEAATNQQNAEAEGLAAKAVKDMADAELKRAKAAETAQDIGLKKIESLSRVLSGQ
jgi:hypothetical protein